MGGSTGFAVTGPNRDVFETLDEESDRGAVIVGGALLDELLAELVSAMLVAEHCTKSVARSFHDRILFCHCRGTLSDEEASDLHTIRVQLRNHFAHSSNRASFADADVASRCNSLRIWTRYHAAFPAAFGVGAGNPRLQFLYVVACLAARIRKETRTAVRPELKPEPQVWDPDAFLAVEER
jgi:hypothetical protein